MSYKKVDKLLLILPKSNPEIQYQELNYLKEKHCYGRFYLHLMFDGWALSNHGALLSHLQLEMKQEHCSFSSVFFFCTEQVAQFSGLAGSEIFPGYKNISEGEIRVSKE